MTRPRLLRKWAVALLWLSATLPGCQPYQPPTAVAPPQAATSTPSGLPESPRTSAGTPTPASGAPLDGATATPVAAVGTLPPARPTAAAPAAPTSISTSLLAGHVRVLAGEIGSRPSNSPNAWRTAGYIREQLAAAGYEAQFQSYNFGYFQDRFSQLILSAPERVQVTVRPFQYSGSGSVAGQLVDCGLGRPTDCPTKRIDNELALVARDGTITLQEKVANVVAKGASAVVVYNDRNGELRGALTAQAKVPAVGITRSDGQQLQQYVRQGKTSVELTVDVRTDSLPGNNVVAGTPGQSIGRRVVIGAHYDSTAMGPGANDNGSGVATLLELARVMRNQKYAFDPIFVAFGDEEVGLVGSRKYLEALSTNQKSQTSAMLNLDMIGVGDSMQFGGTSTLYARAIRTASDMGYRATAIGTRLSASSDHASFQDAGIPAVHFYRAEDPYYHTALDTLDRVQPENMEAAARVALALLDQIGRGN